MINEHMHAHIQYLRAGGAFTIIIRRVTILIYYYNKLWLLV